MAAPNPPSERPQVNPVDLRALDYVDSYDHNLMCAICHAPFVYPVRLQCEHVFCQRCVNDAMYHQAENPSVLSINCPSCRRRIDNRAIAPVPKILTHILDELRVNCPLRSEGCDEILARGEVQSHVDKYCAYSEVGCPSDDCPLMIQRKDEEKQRCLHGMVRCEDCMWEFTERDLEYHRNNTCAIGKSSCPDCHAQVLHRDLEAHIERCPDAIFPCNAAEYGCDFIARRMVLDEHLNTCPLSKLVPFLMMQNDRLEAHEADLKHLRHKNSILETSFSTIQETFSPAANLIVASSSSATGSDTGPFDSTAHHLLCLHESLREEVNRVSAAVSEVDAKASMMVLNESLRVKEDLSHTNAAIGSMRMQLHWLMSARLQNQQRVAMVRAQSLGESLGTGTSSAQAGPSEGVALPVRKLSDSTRQDPKL